MEAERCGRKMTTKNSYLFVGGVKDGTRMCVESQRVEFPVMDGFYPTYTPKDCDIAAMVPFRAERYEAMRFAGEHHDFVVYAERSMNADEVLEMLISRYPGKEKR